MFAHQVRGLSLEAVRNDQVLREAIECQAARLCSLSASQQELASLLLQARRLDDLLASGPRTSAHAGQHRAFHLAIARASGCAGLVETLEEPWFGRLMVLDTISATTLALPRYWHTQLVQAIITREARLAANIMREHVQFNVAKQLELLAAGRWVEPPYRRRLPRPSGGAAEA